MKIYQVVYESHDIEEGETCDEMEKNLNREKANDYEM